MWNPLALAFSAITIVLSTMYKKEATASQAAVSQESSLVSKSLITREALIFLSGAVFTFGIQCVQKLLIRNEHFQRIQIILFNLTNGSDKRNNSLHAPTSLSSKSQIPSEYELLVTSGKRVLGSITQLVSPQLPNTSNTTLNISLIKIQPFCEMSSQRSSPFLEFYYVVSGSGFVSQQGILDTMPLQSGDVFIVDPLSVRWISNKAGKTPLLLLRVMDSGSLYSSAKQPWNEIRLDPNVASGGSLDLIVSQGLAKVQKAASELYKGYSSSSNDIAL